MELRIVALVAILGVLVAHVNSSLYLAFARTVEQQQQQDEQDLREWSQQALDEAQDRH